MTIAKTIAIARKHGLTAGYARVLSGAIRAAASERTANAIREAIREDGAGHLFVALDTNCPLAV